jgi:hypothetical protein
MAAQLVGVQRPHQSHTVPQLLPHTQWAAQSLFKMGLHQLLISGILMLPIILTFSGLETKVAQYSQSHYQFNKEITWQKNKNNQVNQKRKKKTG